MPRNLKSLLCLLLVPCLTVVATVWVPGQVMPPKPSKPKIYSPMPGPESPGFFDGDRVTSEKSMMVDPGVALKLCVAQGDLRINGWSRDEVRVFVKNGRKFRLKALEKSVESGKVERAPIISRTTRSGR